MQSKQYSSKSNAVRAARRYAIQYNNPNVVVLEDNTFTTDGPLRAHTIHTLRLPTTLAPTVPEAPQPNHRRKSTIQSPVQMVWAICEAMEAKCLTLDPPRHATRKEQMRACDAAGIAFYTARTQVQLARKAIREKAATAEA